MNIISRKFFLILFSILLSSPAIHALEVIRADFESQGVHYAVDIGLYNDDVNNTVTNFNLYLDDGSYNNLVINRSVPGFIVQAGALTFDDTLNDGSFSYAGNNQFNGGLQPVLSQGTVANEFKYSNIRGTIAMAKKGGDPDSAANEWFINLTDNTFLDTDNGGYTVFGEILGGMSNIDLISSAPVHDLSSQFINDLYLNSSNFADTPVHNYTDISTIADIVKNDLIIINNFDRLFELTNVVSFIDATVTAEKDIIIKNNNNTPLTLGVIDTSPVQAPFSIASNSCNNQTLQQNGQCIIKTKFTAPDNTADYFFNEFNIDIEPYGYTIPVNIKVPSPKINTGVTELNYGFVPVYNPDDGLPEFTTIKIKNMGDIDLRISSISFDTLTPSEFTFFDNCTTSNNDYAPGLVSADGFCLLVMHFKPVDLAIKTVDITIVSDDPVNSVIKIPVSYGATNDNDGISDDIEKLAPNNGDGNNDGTSDHLQNNVVSFTPLNAPYITLLTDKNVKFSKTQSIDPYDLVSPPENIILGYGVFSFELTNIQIGGLTEFGMILPHGESPTDLYIFGPNTDKMGNYWYKLPKGTIPGINVIGNASYNALNTNLTNVSIVDGGIGDADMTANGVIVFKGGPVISNNYGATTDSSGATLWVSMLIIFVIGLMRPIYR